MAGGQMGFSRKINDPAFVRYLKNSNRYAAIFSLVIAVIAMVGFYIAGETGSEMNNPESLYIGLGVGAMFLLIAFFQIRGRKKSTTWDGTVIDKKILQKRRQRQSGNEHYWEDYRVYRVVIQSNHGKRHEINVEDSDVVYNYYQVGDRVRHHAGLNSYEKYDKSQDSIIFCNACGTLNNIVDDSCFRCHCPLLK